VGFGNAATMKAKNDYDEEVLRERFERTFAARADFKKQLRLFLFGITPISLLIGLVSLIQLQYGAVDGGKLRGDLLMIVIFVVPILAVFAFVLVLKWIDTYILLERRENARIRERRKAWERTRRRTEEQARNVKHKHSELIGDDGELIEG
jgi:hypothetical protein